MKGPPSPPTLEQSGFVLSVEACNGEVTFRSVLERISGAWVARRSRDEGSRAEAQTGSTHRDVAGGFLNEACWLLDAAQAWEAHRLSTTSARLPGQTTTGKRPHSPTRPLDSPPPPTHRGTKR